MKKVILVGLLFTGLSANAQKAAAVKGNDPNKTASGSASVAREATFSSFESNLSSGKVGFARTLTKTGSTSYTTTYTLKLKGSQFNNGKPYEISLTKDAFESFFQRSSNEVAQKWKDLLRFVQSEKLSLTDEESWIRAVNYFNSL